jgi:predicted NAD/FAD-binding protein
MKIAIIGSGVSGLMSARLLHRTHQVKIFEANNYIGGHTNTVEVDVDEKSHAIDTGFIVFNERTYPNFVALLDELQVRSQPTAMSFSVRCDRSGLEYNGTNLNGLFAQRSNLFNRHFLRMTRDIFRFNREGTELRTLVADDMTVADFVESFGYSREFVEHYLLPMGAAIWSCPNGVFEQFPIRFILEFYHNHGLLSLRDRPTWRVIQGGSQSYVGPLIEPFRGRIRLNCPVRSVRRREDSVTVLCSAGQEEFDEVIFACHSDQALQLLAEPTSQEQRVLSAFPYTSSVATLHTDESILPRSRRAWAAWNYRIRPDQNSRSTVTYNMNLLQRIQSRNTFLVSLNEEDAINPNKKLATFQYSHPSFTTDRSQMQSQHDSLIRRNRTSYCGAWWGAGFHEDGVNSALAVCRHFGIRNWIDELSLVSDRKVNGQHSQFLGKLVEQGVG